MSHFQPMNASAHPEYQHDENMQSIEHSFVYAMDPRTTVGLTRSYFGGRWSGFSVSEFDLTLTDDAGNYVVVLRSNGVASVSTATTNWNDTSSYARVEKITVADGAYDEDADVENHRAGLYGAHGPTQAANAAEFKGLTFTSDTGSTADTDPGNGLFKWNNATQASATVLYFDNQTADGISLTTLWGNLASNGYIHLQQSDDASKWQLWRWTAAPVDGTGYRKFTCTLQASGGSIADDKTVFITFTSDRPNAAAPTFIAPRVASTASSATPTPDADTTDVYILTALAAGATFGAPTGTPVQGQALLIRIKDNGSAQTLAFNAIYRALGITLPTTTVISKTMYLAATYNSTDTKWDVVGLREEA